MNVFKKLLLWALVVIILIFAGLLSYVTLALPDVGKPENIKIALTPQRAARGEYLANHVCLCMDCHSQRDWSKPIGAIASDKLGAGGDDFDSSLGVPGDIYVPNITPYKLKDWTDGEIFRAITTGERKDGSAIYPFMPWPAFSKMSREDLYSIIVYLRTLKPIATKPYPKSKLDFPVNIMVHTMPQKATLGNLPSASDVVKYGGYLVRSASCSLCHSQKKDGDAIPGLELAGGIKFPMGKITIVSANITPDKNTGIGSWTSDGFVKLFKSHSVVSNKPPSPEDAGMPWYDYSGMTETDLKAIFEYLKTVKAVKNNVVTFQQPMKR
jgi:hypothetical protein